MSHHSEDILPGSDSFWEPGNYKKTTKRIEDGNKLCSDFMNMVSERAEIEKSYAKQLKTWALKWNNTIEKGPEYGTTEAAWKAVLVEADRRCELHNKVKEDLNIKVNNQIKSWQKDHYHKTMMNLKEKKDLDDAFKKAQKPWAKLLNKVNKSRIEYHNACKAERTALNHERNATGDSQYSADQLKKLQDRVQKCKDNVQKTKENYEMCLQDISNYNPRYMEDMTDVFEKCQQMEGQRLQTFKDIMFTFQKCLNISEDPVLPQIYEEFYHTVNNADHEKDLRWWSNAYGVNMTMKWPEFEEYTEEFRDIGGKGHKKTGQIADPNITLLNQRSVGDDLPEYSSVVSAKQNGTAVKAGNNPRSNASSARGQGGNSKTAENTGSNGAGAASFRNELSNGNSKVSKSDANPFDEDEWEDQLVDNGEPGVKVRALYDYEAAEDDELTFKTGDIFEKLEDEDEQGWCKGRKDNRVGLYPANYIELV